jgi:hypothetical protein
MNLKHMKNLNHAKKLLSQIDQEIDGVEFESIDERNRVSGALLDIVLDHANAIIVLIEKRIYSSAYALVRPLFEGFVRATWLLNCATDDEIELLVEKDKFKKSFGEMLECIERKKAWPKTLAKAKESAWKAMHSYTHGGLHQISRKIKISTIEPVIDNEEIEEIICFAELISTLSFSAMIAMSKDSGKDNVLKKFMESVSQECFNK